ncbi:hypothetical protein AVEN_131109-1 [Araneus ventricosus]|uniref:Transposase Tc1-like domain-containing protein n=1 Tax=Araneus ventricosus TaxID=182803 RepID=A0A4Y2GEQ6_ARAVE|nr:hypothetical protein AVEN_131109-1 [Araneus ventricosus]
MSQNLVREDHAGRIFSVIDGYKEWFSSQKMLVREITGASQLQISKNTVHRRIIESGYMIRAKMARRLPLSKLHISKRLQWARNHMSYGDKWMSVLFSDEKKNATSMDLTGI